MEAMILQSSVMKMAMSICGICCAARVLSHPMFQSRWFCRQGWIDPRSVMVEGSLMCGVFNACGPASDAVAVERNRSTMSNYSTDREGCQESTRRWTAQSLPTTRPIVSATLWPICALR